MKKFIAITIALLALIPVTVNAEQPCGLSMTDAETIQGGIAEMSVYADFGAELHILLFEIYYPIPLSVESVTAGEMLNGIESALVYINTDEAGQISVGILCAAEGITGIGELLQIRFRFAPYYANGWETVYLHVTEADHDELGGEAWPIQIDDAAAIVFVHAPTTDDVLSIVRWLHFNGAEYAPWYDVNQDGEINLADALVLLRKVMGLI